MKENTGAVHAQVPVDVATFLLNEKRLEIHNIETRFRVNVLLIPNIHLETPNYELERLRSDSEKLETATPSYQMMSKPSAEVTTEKGNGNGNGNGHNKGKPESDAKPTERPVPIVKGITPSQPAPMAADPVESRNKVVAPTAPVAVVEKTLWQKITGFFSGEPAPVVAPVAVTPARSTSTRADGSKTERGDRGERKDRNDRGDRGERGGKGRTERGDRGGKGRGERVERGERTDRPDKNGRRDRVDGKPADAKVESELNDKQALLPKANDEASITAAPQLAPVEGAEIAKPRSTQKSALENKPADAEGDAGEGGDGEAGTRRRRSRGGRGRGRDRDGERGPRAERGPRNGGGSGGEGAPAGDAGATETAPTHVSHVTPTISNNIEPAAPIAPAPQSSRNDAPLFAPENLPTQSAERVAPPQAAPAPVASVQAPAPVAAPVATPVAAPTPAPQVINQIAEAAQAAGQGNESRRSREGASRRRPRGGAGSGGSAGSAEVAAPTGLVFIETDSAAAAPAVLTEFPKANKPRNPRPRRGNTGGSESLVFVETDAAGTAAPPSNT